MLNIVISGVAFADMVDVSIGDSFSGSESRQRRLYGSGITAKRADPSVSSLHGPGHQRVVPVWEPFAAA